MRTLNVHSIHLKRISYWWYDEKKKKEVILIRNELEETRLHCDIDKIDI